VVKPLQGKIGPAAPYALLHADPKRRFVVMCQARLDTDNNGKIDVGHLHHGERVGDAFLTYLVASDTDEEIGEFIGVDPTGTYLAYTENDQLVLRNLPTGRIDVLDTNGPVARRKNALLPHAAASFGGRGGFLVYQRKRATGSVAVVHNLKTGGEHELQPVPGHLWRAELSDDERWVIVESVMADTNGDGRVGAPDLASTLLGDVCGSPAAYTIFGWYGDRPETWLARIPDDSPQKVPGYIFALGDQVLRRTEDGAIVADDLDGSTEPRIPAECGGVVIAARDHWLLVACTASPSSAAAGRPIGDLIDDCMWADRPSVECLRIRDSEHPVYAYGGPRPIPLGISASVGMGDHQLAATAEPLVLAGNPPVVFDWRTGRLTRLDGVEYVTAQWKSRLLLKRGADWVWRDLASGRQSMLAPVQDYFGGADGHQRFVYRTPWLFDLQEGRLVGKVSGDVLAVSEDGLVLTDGSSAPVGELSPARSTVERLLTFGKHGWTHAPVAALEWISPRAPE
jgi:hypothetical protein